MQLSITVMPPYRSNQAFSTNGSLGLIRYKMIILEYMYLCEVIALDIYLKQFYEELTVIKKGEEWRHYLVCCKSFTSGEGHIGSIELL